MTVADLLELIHEQRLHNADVVNFEVGMIAVHDYPLTAAGIIAFDTGDGQGKFAITNLLAPEAAELALEVRKVYGADITDMTGGR